MWTLVRVLAVTSLIQLSQLDRGQVEELRLLHGHEGADTATVHVAYADSAQYRRLTKRETSVGVLPKRHDSLKLKVTFETSGHVLDLDLKPSKLSHDGAKVVVRYGEEKKEYVWRDKGCHYHGTFNEERGEASVHFCHGVVIGGAHLKDMEYYIHPHPDDIIDHDDHSDIPDDHIEHYPGLTDDAIDTGAGSRVVVTWKKPDPLPFQTEDTPTSDAAITRRRRQASESGPEITDAESADPDFDETEEEQQEPIEPEKKSDKHVNPDFDPNQPIVVEFALVMDERYLKLIANRHHYTDDEHFINFAITKYTGVQAVYGNRTAVGFDFQIQIKRIELFRQNPKWYNAMPHVEKLGGRMQDMCTYWPNGELMPHDAVNLWTIGGSGYSGLAFSGICRPKFKCFGIQNGRVHWWTESHEFGHTLGFSHDGRDKNCPPYHGFMGSNMFKFIPCYRDILQRTMRHKGRKCLYTQGLPNNPVVELQKGIPIMSRGLDEFCNVAFRPGSVYLPQDDQAPCRPMSCAVLDQSSPNYGAMGYNVDRGYDGRPCGEGGVCYKYECHPANYTAALQPDPAEVAQWMQDGQWSSWSDYGSTCSSPCGTGIHIASRTCSVARHEACPGARFRAVLCNQQPCPGDRQKDETAIKNDRADYICNYMVLKGVLSREVYTGRGRVKFTEGQASATCGVTCEMAKKSDNPINAFQPDGTRCDGEQQLERFVKGVNRNCVQGLCIRFGCNGRSIGAGGGLERDMCGVCGGDNSTCNHGHTEFTVPARSNLTVKALPAGSSDILFFHQWVKKQEFFMVLQDKEDIIRIETDVGGREKGNVGNPLNFAGTYWSYVPRGQAIEAPGPIDMPVKIMLYNKGFENITKTIYWRYNIPDPIPPAPECENSNGQWLGGCVCREGFYGRLCQFPCDHICFNGQPMKTHGRCSCICDTARMTNKRCVCMPQFTGRDCQNCTFTSCFHGGTFHEETCSCTCPPGCGGDDCWDCGPHMNKGAYRGFFSNEMLERRLKSDGQAIRASWWLLAGLLAVVLCTDAH